MAEVHFTADVARQFLDYDPSTGVFTRKKNTGKKFKTGTVTGHAMTNGYILITLFYKQYLAHRLAWLIMTGEWPKHQIDHIDRDRSNNKWSNLREATNKQNSENHSIRSDNTSGKTGVYFCKTKKKWKVCICHHGKSHSFGYHKNLEDAIAVRVAAERQFFSHSASSLPVESREHLAQQDETGSSLL